ncbi:hypothetical protein LCGC14_1881960 [marine sediment metagenome]|uniref:Uncharacterized protein n=1 Tax=marine sediment metagenome TaxID=412755 RepID=A0A0F9J0D6_9ZZZZ
MAKSKLRLRARGLRKQGKSIREITKKIPSAKSSISRWCRDIELTQEQTRRLLANKESGIRRGQLKGALVQKQKRLTKIEEYKQEGLKRLRYISLDAFLIAGLALYLGEGSKKENKVAFVNSDPEIIKFMITWLKTCFDVPPEQLVCSVLINKAHQYREKEIRIFWQNSTGIPEEQFRKTRFVKTKQRKIYENQDTYYGTLTVRALKSSDLFYRIEGLMNGLLESSTHTCRRSSVVRAKPS